MVKETNQLERGEIKAVHDQVKALGISYQTVYRRVREGLTTRKDNIIDHAKREVIARRKNEARKLKSTVFADIPFIHELPEHFKSIVYGLDQFHRIAKGESPNGMEADQVVQLDEDQLDWVYENLLLPFNDKSERLGIVMAVHETENGCEENSVVFHLESNNETFTYKILAA